MNSVATYKYKQNDLKFQAVEKAIQNSSDYDVYIDIYDVYIDI